MFRSLSALLLFALAACGDATPAESTARASPVEVRLVADDPAVRQRLTPSELLGYFPEALGDLEPNIGRRALYDDAADASRSRASVRYTRPTPPREQIEIAAEDYVDDPEGLARERPKIADGTDIDTYGTGEVSDRREIDGGAGRSFVGIGGAAPELFILLADRFFVTVRAERRDMTVDELWAIYDASGVGRLAGAPTRGGAGIPAVPAWATDAVAEWESTTEAPTSPPAPVAAARPLLPCDDVLPLAEVERTCGVSGARVYPTAFMDEGPAACNRKYAVPRNLSGLVFIVSRFGDAATARQAQRVASESEYATQRRDVAGLGDAATRYVRDSEAQRTTTGVLAVAVGTDLVEMKTTTMPDEPDAEVCTLDQLEALAHIVAGRLAP